METKNWWEIYPKLNSAKFTNENSGKMLGEPIPFGQTIDGPLRESREMSRTFEILGYTLNPPFPAPYPYVAILFMRKDDFSEVWFHYGK